MKKLLAIAAAFLAFSAGATNTYNTLDQPPSTTIAAGTAIIGKVGIDQTTPGTTNLVAASITDGTQTANTVAGDASQNAILIAGNRKEVSFTTTSAQPVAATDVSNYSWVSVHLVTSGTNSVTTFQVSNDNTNWVSTALTRSVASLEASSTTALVSTVYSGPLAARYFRINVTAITAGTTAGVVEFSSIPRVPTSYGVVASLGNGQGAHGSAIAGQPVRSAARAVTANYTAVTTGQTADLVSTLVGAQVVKPFSIPEADWSYAAASGGIANTTTAVTVQGAAGAGIRNYVTSIELYADALTNATEFAVRDGAGGTVLWRHKINTAGLLAGYHAVFASPLKGTAATLLEVVTITASGAGAVYANLQGYQAP